MPGTPVINNISDPYRDTGADRAQNYGPSIYRPPTGGHGGGGGGAAAMQTPSGSFWDAGGLARKSGMRGWVLSPEQELAQQKQGFDQQKFQTLFGTLQNMMGGQWGSSVGGQSGPSPEISVGPIFNPQQIDQKVNAARASNDATLAGTLRRNTQAAAGGGFGANSPFAAANNQSARNANMAANTGAERDIRFGAAGDNAQHILETQGAREQQFASRMEEDIARRKVTSGNMNALVQALAGL